jgi:hypothetical protein
MLAILGTLLILASCLGVIFVHLFVWPAKHPGEPLSWQVWAAFGGTAVVGIGLLTGSWPVVLLGVAIRIFSWLMRNNEKIAG